MLGSILHGRGESPLRPMFANAGKEAADAHAPSLHLHSLDVIPSPISYPCQWVGRLVCSECEVV